MSTSEQDAQRTVIIRLNEIGANQIAEAAPGMTFIVHYFRGKDAWVRDYRAATPLNPYIVCPIYEGAYEVLEDTYLQPAPPTMKLEEGTRFLHAHWLNEKNEPLECVVTLVRVGNVFWRRADSDEARDYFPLSKAHRYVKKVLVQSPAPESQQPLPA